MTLSLEWQWQDVGSSSIRETGEDAPFSTESDTGASEGPGAHAEWEGKLKERRLLSPGIPERSGVGEVELSQPWKVQLYNKVTSHSSKGVFYLSYAYLLGRHG